MTSSSSTSSCLIDYRDKAARLFAAAVKERALLQRQRKQTPYSRHLYPALSAYLHEAALRYAAWKNAPRHVARALGTCPDPVLLVAGDVRRVHWLAHLSSRRHFVSGPATLFYPSILPCGIPADIRKRYADKHRLLLRRILRPTLLFSFPLGSSSSSSSSVEVPFTEHVIRCKASTTRKCLVLSHLLPEQDSFDEVRARYRRFPDELYRRKSSRRFATWRRSVTNREEGANATMHACRGHDQLLTTRSYGDTSFAPFLFETQSHAYAYSSKISDAPKLRKVMLDKYATQQPVQRQDPLEKAHVAAETTPLFHTRVMNRFG